MARDWKPGKCPRCCPDGGAILGLEIKDWDDDSQPVRVWRCRNCGHERPYTPRKRPQGVTAAQSKAIDKAIRLSLEWAGKNHVVKCAWASIPERPGQDLLLYVRTGYEDRPDYAWGDRYSHLFIGPSGSIYTYAKKTPKARKERKVRGWKAIYLGGHRC